MEPSTVIADLVGGAVRLALGDEPALVITVEVWRALKAAAGREKDLRHLDQLDNDGA